MKVINDSEIKVSGDGLHVYFYCEVTAKTVLDLTMVLRELAQEIDSREAVNGVLRPPPVINLHINSPGGGLHSGLAAYDNIRSLTTPVRTLIEGSCCSAATFISLAGSHRVMGKRAIYLIHPISKFLGWSKAETFKEEKKNLDIAEKIIKKLYKRHSNLTKKEIEEILKTETIMTASECKRVGLIDDIL